MPSPPLLTRTHRRLLAVGVLIGSLVLMSMIGAENWVNDLIFVPIMFAVLVIWGN